MHKLLVAFGSKHGSTAEIAEALGGRLREHGFEVHVRSAAEIESVEEYEAIVIGSANYLGHWREDAMHFLRRFEPEPRKPAVLDLQRGPARPGRRRARPPSSERGVPPGDRASALAAGASSPASSPTMRRASRSTCSVSRT